MALEADAVVARRRLKRQLGWWRILAVLGIAAAVVVAVGRFGGIPGQDYVAELTVEGLIVADRERDGALAAVAADDNARALIVLFNSPGGSVVGGEDLYNSLRDVAAAKPVVAVMGTLATSAAYMGAVAADRIFARQSTVTGSIGVLFQTTEFSVLLERLGVTAEAIKSSPLKAQPSLIEPLSDEGRVAAMALVEDMYDFFVGIVAERRQFSEPEVRQLADGRVFTGRQALSNGLIDAIGDPAAARDWLADSHDIDRALPMRPVIDEDGGLLLDFATGLVEKTLISKALTLDGLTALWQPGRR